MPPPARERKERLFNGAMLLFLGLAAIAAGLIFWRGGTEALVAPLQRSAHDSLGILPQLVLGLVVAGLTTAVLPRETIASLVGSRSGMRGILLATGLGSIMPGGPFASFPLVLALAEAGADMGALIAFLIAWATIGINRLIVWEIPFMGIEFGVLRLIASIPLPILAGLFARVLVRHLRRADGG